MYMSTPPPFPPHPLYITPPRRRSILAADSGAIPYRLGAGHGKAERSGAGRGIRSVIPISRVQIRAERGTAAMWEKKGGEVQLLIV